METEDKDSVNNSINEEIPEKEGEKSEEGDRELTDEDQELLQELNQHLERERQLQLVLHQKEKHAKQLAKKYENLKTDLWEETKRDLNKHTEVRIDSSLLKEITVLKDKINEKSQRLELLQRELDSHNKSHPEQAYHQRFKNMEELQTYQKLSNENPHLETYLRSEYYKSSLDKVQALKQLSEQLAFEVERATVVKSELEEDKSKFDSHLKQIRSEFKKLQDENERLAEEADRRKNSL